jgi:hypothetical protein
VPENIGVEGGGNRTNTFLLLNVKTECRSVNTHYYVYGRSQRIQCCKVYGTSCAVAVKVETAAAHIGQYATIEGVVAKVFTSTSGNTFLNIGAAYPNQTFTGWIHVAWQLEIGRRAKQDN